MGWGTSTMHLNQILSCSSPCYEDITMGCRQEVFTITLLLDFAANRQGMTYEQVLRSDVSSHVLDNLQEDREYNISIYAMYPEGPSRPVAAVGRTCKRFDSVAGLFLPWALSSHPLQLISASQLVGVVG